MNSTDPKLGIVWEGALAALHSMALVNRALCRCLAARGHDLAILPSTSPDLGAPLLPPSGAGG